MSSTTVFGNYHGYYTKRPFINDQRLGLLPPGLFKDARVLDVGCNEGWVTSEIAQLYSAKLVIGVDIDSTLIQGAWRRRRAVWSFQKPTLPQNHAQNETSGLCLPVPNYFPASCEHEFGSLPIPPSANRGTDVFPHNLAFRTADWIRTSIPEDKDGYDVVLGLSVTKWIHLHDGDEGIKTFFRRVFDVLRPAGKFVLEPQPWESYRKARRGDAELKEKAASFQIKPEEFGNVLEGIGFRQAGRFVVGEGKPGFQRPVELYVKPQ